MVKWCIQVIVCALGYGYLAQFVFKRICALGIKGIGVTSKNINNNEFTNIILVNRDKITEVLTYSTHLLITAPPDDKGCSILNKFSSQILASNIKSLIYISTTGVYGNHNGDWVDENSNLIPKTSRGILRKKSEVDHLNLFRLNSLPIHIFRLPGIYGPGRSVFDKVRNGQLTEIIKKGHFFSRVYVEDIGSAINKSIKNPTPGEIFNLSDDMPCQSSEIVRYAASLIKISKISVMLKYRFSR